jgi:hypothetical protein
VRVGMEFWSLFITSGHGIITIKLFSPSISIFNTPISAVYHTMPNDSDEGISTSSCVSFGAKAVLSVAILFQNDYSTHDMSSSILEGAGMDSITSMVTVFEIRNSYDGISSLKGKSFNPNSTLSLSMVTGS